LCTHSFLIRTARDCSARQEGVPEAHAWLVTVAIAVGFAEFADIDDAGLPKSQRNPTQSAFHRRADSHVILLRAKNGHLWILKVDS
jgi:hypothetical protein